MVVPPLAFVDVGTALEGTSGFVAYPLIFLLAMIPLIEPFVVIPVAIGLGFDPVLTGLAAFGGSVTAVVAIVLAGHRLRAWWVTRSDSNTDTPAGSDSDTDNPAGSDSDTDESGGRYERARRVAERYGLVGLALAGPPLAGLHLMAIVGAAVGPDDRATIGWLTAGLAVWTVALVAGSVAGLSALDSFFTR